MKIKLATQSDCAVLGTWKRLQPSLSPPANWDSGSFSCPFEGKNLEKGDVFLSCFICFSHNFISEGSHCSSHVSLKKETWL